MHHHNAELRVTTLMMIALQTLTMSLEVLVIMGMAQVSLGISEARVPALPLGRIYAASSLHRHRDALGPRECGRIRSMQVRARERLQCLQHPRQHPPNLNCMLQGSNLHHLLTRMDLQPHLTAFARRRSVSVHSRRPWCRLESFSEVCMMQHEAPVRLLAALWQLCCIS